MSGTCDVCGGCSSDPCSMAVHEEHARETVAREFASMTREVREVASALEAMGSEADWNLSMPQTVRDMCRHQAARLRKAIPDTDT